MNRENSKSPAWNPDALVMFSLLSTVEGGRKTAATDGYRPHYKIKNDYLTSTAHWFTDQESIFPGSNAKAYIKFATPDAFPNSLSIGQVIEVGEGLKIIGESEVLEIYNEKLQAS